MISNLDAPEQRSATAFTDALRVLFDQVVLELNHLLAALYDLGWPVWMWILGVILVLQFFYDSRSWLWTYTKRTLKTYGITLLVLIALLLIFSVGRVFLWRSIRRWWSTYVAGYWVHIQTAVANIWQGPVAVTPVHVPPVVAQALPTAPAPTPPPATGVDT